MSCTNFQHIDVGIEADTDEKLKLQKKEVVLNYDTNKWSEKIYKPYSKTILLFITNQCNLDCVNCFYRSSITKKPDEMSFEYIKKIVDNNPDVEKYDIMGGEPLIHSEIDRILSFLEEKNKKIGLYTNGFILNRLKRGYKNLRVNIAFHSIDSNNPSLKPIHKLASRINDYSKTYPMKLFFLMTNENKLLLNDFVKYVEENFEYIDKLTIGAIRNEADYYNDNYPGIMNLEEYCTIIEEFLKNYKGRLNIDIFGEGILITDKLPKSAKNQINRFRCVFKDNYYTHCLYDIGPNKQIKFDPEKPLKFDICSHCPKTKKNRCLTDKIKLQNKKF